LRRFFVLTVEYLLGFLALAIFAYLAFATGAPTDERFVSAFKITSVIAAVELAVLGARAAPANRLIIGANLWLVLGGAAAFLEQWWLLKIYQRFGEASLFTSILAVGFLSTALSPAGFIGKVGNKAIVLQRSLMLCLAVLVALAIAIFYQGNVKFAAVFPIIALSWFNRLLRQAVPNEPSET
jgi:hypothetical protein